MKTFSITVSVGDHELTRVYSLPEDVHQEGYENVITDMLFILKQYYDDNSNSASHTRKHRNNNTAF